MSCPTTTLGWKFRIFLQSASGLKAFPNQTPMNSKKKNNTKNTTTNKKKVYIPNLQWDRWDRWDRDRITMINIPIYKENKWEAQLLLVNSKAATSLGKCFSKLLSSVQEHSLFGSRFCSLGLAPQFMIPHSPWFQCPPWPYGNQTVKNMPSFGARQISQSTHCQPKLYGVTITLLLLVFIQGYWLHCFFRESRKEAGGREDEKETSM